MKKPTIKYLRHNKTKIRKGQKRKYRNRTFRKKRAQHGFETRSIKYFKGFSKPKKYRNEDSILNLSARV